MAELQSIIKLSQADFDTLANGGTITKDGKQYVYDSNALYCVQTDIPQPIIDVTTLPTTDIQTDSLYRVAGQVTHRNTTADEFTPLTDFVGWYKFTDDAINNNDATVMHRTDGTNQISWYPTPGESTTKLVITSGAAEERYNPTPYVSAGILEPTDKEHAICGFFRPDPNQPTYYQFNTLTDRNDNELFDQKPSKLYHYKDNAWIEIQPSTDATLATTDKTIVGAINEINADKAPLSSLKHVGSKSLSADLLWDISEPTSTEMRVKIAADTIDPIGVTGYGTMVIIERRAGTGNESQVFIEFYANRDAANSPLQTPFNKYVKMGILPAEHNGAFATQFPNITWSKWMRVEQGEHNTLNASGATNVNNCIFQLVGMRGTRYFRDSKLYYASMTDPFSNTTIYGECLTEEMNRANKLYITQTFKQYTADNASQVVFKRQGYFTFSTDEGAWDNAAVIANIVWQAWFPIEYPDTALTLNSGWTGNIHFSVTGGILLINVLNLVKTASATSALPIDATANSALVALPIKYVVWGTIFNSNSVAPVKVKWQQKNEEQEGGLVTSTLMVADEPYLGTLQIHLGY